MSGQNYDCKNLQRLTIINEIITTMENNVDGFRNRFMDDMELGGLQQAPAISGRTLR